MSNNNETHPERAPVPKHLRMTYFEAPALSDESGQWISCHYVVDPSETPDGGWLQNYDILFIEENTVTLLEYLGEVQNNKHFWKRITD